MGFSACAVSMLFFFSNKGSLAFYITDLRVLCEFHGRLFTGDTIDGHHLRELKATINSVNEDHELQRCLGIEHLVPFEFPFKGPSEPKPLLNGQNPSSDEYLLKHLQSLKRSIHLSNEIEGALRVIARKSKYFNSV